MQTIGHEELKTVLDSGKNVLLIDVLSEDAFENEHIPGSENIPYENNDAVFADKVENLADSKDAEIIVYCASTDCPASSRAARSLEKAGFTNITAFEGGLQDWKDASYDLEGEDLAGGLELDMSEEDEEEEETSKRSGKSMKDKDGCGC
jgi:rhodanese-related sulfurtransferase